METKKIPDHIRVYIEYAVSTAISRLMIKNPGNIIELSTPTDEFLSADQAAEILKIKLSTLYSKVESGDIPYSRSGKRKLLFLRSDLIQFISNKRCKSMHELSQEAENYINTQKHYENKKTKS
jgi:excisionase family DNA binding protein